MELECIGNESAVARLKRFEKAEMAMEFGRQSS